MIFLLLPPQSVSNCVYALGIARSYLRRDALDVAFKPEMYNTTMPQVSWHDHENQYQGGGGGGYGNHHAGARGIQATAVMIDVLAQQV